MARQSLHPGKSGMLFQGVLLLYLLAPLLGGILPAGSKADWSGLICSAAGNQAQWRTLQPTVGGAAKKTADTAVSHAASHQCCSMHAAISPQQNSQASQPFLRLLQKITWLPAASPVVIRQAWLMPLSRAPPFL